MLSTHLSLGLLSGLLHSAFLTKILYAFLFSPIHVTFPAHLMLLDLVILIIFGEEYNLTKVVIMQFSATSCHLIPLQSRYSPQHLVLKHPQSVFVP
jgi:hypothetical protein